MSEDHEVVKKNCSQHISSVGKAAHYPVVQTFVIYSWSILYVLLHNHICDLIFACGCPPIWSTVWTCNILTPGPMNRRCPWCQPWFSPATEGWYHLYFFNSSFDQGGLSVLALYACPWGFKLIIFIAIQVVVGKVYQIYTGYPYFLGMGELPLSPTPSGTTTIAPPSGDDSDGPSMWLNNFAFVRNVLLWSWGDVAWVLFFISIWKLTLFLIKCYNWCTCTSRDNLLASEEPKSYGKEYGSTV